MVADISQGRTQALCDRQWWLHRCRDRGLLYRVLLAPIWRTVSGGAQTSLSTQSPQSGAHGSKPDTASDARVVLPIGDNAECRSLLHDLLLAVWARAEALRLPLDALGDPTTLASRLDDELDAYKSFAAFVGLVGGFARKAKSSFGD